jgi:regulator of protease activity HflC (stomatin/prohibitin superfamily)
MSGLGLSITASVVTAVVCGLIALMFLWWLFGGVRIINQVERGIVFRFGRARTRIRKPGLAIVIPFIDRVHKVNIQIVTMPVPSQEGITRDNVSVKVDAVVYFRVQDPYKAAIEVQNYYKAVELLAQTSLRSGDWQERARRSAGEPG